MLGLYPLYSLGLKKKKRKSWVTVNSLHMNSVGVNVLTQHPAGSRAVPPAGSTAPPLAPTSGSGSQSSESWGARDIFKQTNTLLTMILKLKNSNKQTTNILKTLMNPLICITTLNMAYNKYNTVIHVNGWTYDLKKITTVYYNHLCNRPRLD